MMTGKRITGHLDRRGSFAPRHDLLTEIGRDPTCIFWAIGLERMRSGWLAVLPASHDPCVKQISVAIGGYVGLFLAADDYRVVYPFPLQVCVVRLLVVKSGVRFMVTSRRANVSEWCASAPPESRALRR